MNVLEENLAVLQRRFPALADRVRASPTAGLRGGDVSDDDAGVVARRWLHGRRIRRGALLAVSGFGDGVHVRELLRVLPEASAIFVGEAALPEFRCVLETRDWTAVLEDERLLLGLGPLDDAYFEPISAAHAAAMLDAEPWLFAPCFNRAPEYYAKFFLEFARFLDFRRKLEGTRIVDAALWQQNSFLNLRALAAAPEIDSLAGLFRGRPAVLVSAGPSLDESLDFLRAARDIAVIIAVNSSYRALRRAGIVPHLVLAADPRDFTARGFAGVPTDSTWLVTTPIVYPEVVRLFEGRTFIWSGANELFTEWRRRLGMPPGVRIVEQGTVSACGVDLAIIMGCDRVCLVGQDLAVKDDGQSHASDSFYTDMQANHVDLSSCRKLPGNTRPAVWVEEKLYVYLKTFEQLALHRRQARFCNTARLGARIEGMPYMDFSKALAWLGTKSTAGAMDGLAKRHREGQSNSLGVDRVLEQTKAVRPYAVAVLGAALAAVSRLEALPLQTLEDGQSPGADVATALDAVEHLRSTAERDRGNYAILEGGRTRLELFKAATLNLQTAHGGPAMVRRLLAAREYAWAVAEGAWFLLNELEGLVGATGNGKQSVKPA